MLLPVLLLASCEITINEEQIFPHPIGDHINDLMFYSKEHLGYS